MTAAPRVVFDCTTFAQALMNPFGPAGRCLTAAQDRKFELFVSDYVLAEVRELPQKLPPRFRVTSERVESLIFDLAKYAVFAEKVPVVFQYPRDPDDAHYIDLAAHVEAAFIVSRDKDLLDLSGSGTAAAQFKARFPDLLVIDPRQLLEFLDKTASPD